MTAVGWSQSFHKLDALLDTPPQYRNSPNQQGD